MPHRKTNSHTKSPKNLITTKNILKISILALLILTIGNLTIKQIRLNIFVDIDHYWPISIFLFKYPQLLDLPAYIAIGVISWRYLKNWDPAQTSIQKVILYTGLLIISTNLLQGVQDGFIHPVAGINQFDDKYWQDASKITNLPRFLDSYTHLQPFLETHSRTHPPGPIILLFFTQNIISHPLFSTLIILIIGLASQYFIYQIINNATNHNTAILTAAFYGLIPAIQIYTISSIDVIICTLFIGTLWAWLNFKNRLQIILTGLLGWLASLMTFSAIFLAPILLILVWQNKKQLKNLILSGLGGAILHISFWITTGFNYFTSFQIARQFEGNISNLLSFPNYLVTRIEDIVEIAIFFTPLACYLLFKSYNRLNNQPHYLAYKAAIITFLLMLLAGAYLTGETARAALFVYPFLIMGLTEYFQRYQPTLDQQKLLLVSTLFTTILMQTFGWYAW